VLLSAASSNLIKFTLAGGLLLGLMGCGSQSSSVLSSTGSTYPGTAFAGHVMSGRQPLIGASVALFAAGTTGIGSSATSLLAASLTTDSSGAFSVPGGYTCPSASSQLYLVARGGKAGSAGAANSAIAFASALGACNKVAAGAQFTVNEVTTVAGVYALSQFLAPGGNIGASSTNSTGISNAFATATALGDPSTGSSPGATFAANGSSPATMINAVANTLNACAMATPTASACTGLFSATTVSGASAPTDTLDAALNLVRHPAANVSALYALATASSAFTPALATAPPDWTLSINFTGGGMKSPTALGIDSAGNVWVANYFNVASEFSNTGVPIYAHGITGNGLNASYGLAVDANNNVWIPNEPGSGNGSSITVFNSAGQSISGSGGFTAGGLNYPIALAIDTDGSVWAADNADSSVTHLSSSGAALSGASGYSDASIGFPDALAIDPSHNVWVGTSGTAVAKVSPNGAQFTPYSCCDFASALAFDQRGNLWIANYYGDSVSEISSSGAVVSAGYAGGGLAHPQGIAIDGAGNVWVANFRANALTELAGASSASPGSALSPANGIGSSANLVQAYALAIDASGNLWVTNSGANSNTLTEYVGLAAPVKTPLIGLPVAP
jgi:streptogramin lyase